MAAGAVDVPLEYVRLGLRFDRVEPGFVDAYTGDPRIRAEVDDEPAPTPQQLRDSARSLAGEPVGYLDEVRAYFQVDVELGDPAVYAAAHADLDALLPGDGTLA